MSNHADQEQMGAFERFAAWCAKALGHALAFSVATLVIVVWAVSGPLFHFSDTWQLVVNTGTTVLTFLMVFVIQNTLNRDSAAVHVKLDELIRVTNEARDNLPRRGAHERAPSRRHPRSDGAAHVGRPIARRLTVPPSDRSGSSPARHAPRLLDPRVDTRTLSSWRGAAEGQRGDPIRTLTSTLANVALLGETITSFAEYVDTGGGRGLEVALGATPEAVIDEVTKSGLRGRGGAGFPTGEKWRSIRTTGTGARFAVCNGAEGEPATFKDRALMRTNPYQILEGLAIAGHAIGAERCYVGIKGTFTEEVRAISSALEEMREADALGGRSLEVVVGPDLYLFGEETGLEEVIEGRPPLPRIARPFMLGLFASPPKDNPTLVNNVETLANVPRILADGPDWLRTNGTETSPGTMVFTVCGDVQREGVFELPLGTPLRSLVEDQAGGPREDRSIKAIFPGASNTVILPEQLDTPLDFDSMREVGSSLGAGGFAVFDDTACMVRAAYLYSRFLWIESCAQCPACKFGTGEVTKALDEIELGGRAPDLDLILARARSSTDGQKCALPTGESLLMQSIVQVFADELRAHVGTPCPLPRELPFHKIVGWDPTMNRFEYDPSYASKRPDWTFDT